MAIFFRKLLNNLEDWGYVLDPFYFTYLFQLLNNHLCRLIYHNSLTYQIWSIARYKQGQCFSEIFEQF